MNKRWALDTLVGSIVTLAIACGPSAPPDASDAASVDSAGTDATTRDVDDAASMASDSPQLATDGSNVNLDGDPPLPCFIDGCASGLTCCGDNVCRATCPDS